MFESGNNCIILLSAGKTENSHEGSSVKIGESYSPDYPIISLKNYNVSLYLFVRRAT